MDLLQSIILGVVEGLTEFLPVSSTGHLILVSELLYIPQSEFLTTFQIVIQLGAIMAVVLLYWRRLFLEWEVMKRIMVALLPALGIGFLFYSFIRKLLTSDMTVVWALGIGGIILIAFEYFRKGKDGDVENLSILPYRTAFLIGLFQALAVIPGVSRSGATILGGLTLGMKRKAIVEFSFLLAAPTMFAATALDFWKHGAAFSSVDLHLLGIGLLVSFLVAVVAIKWLLRFVESHSFIVFGVYRIVVAVLFFFFMGLTR
ncbi:MAG: undecaprenyl-diphosphate phosphatase [Candidatus Moraniibacteriota bacterium]